MFRKNLFVFLIATAAVTSCSSIPPTVTRNAMAPDLSQETAATDHALIRQANALEKASQEILRRSTLQGAALGAAAGCGLAALSASGAGKCVTGALAGGAVGAVAGHAVGQAQVAKRVEIVKLSRVMPAMRDADGHMDRVQADLPALLKAQEAEMAALDAGLADGTVTLQEHAARLGAIRDTRQQLSAALALTASQARAAHAALKSAEGEGQEGLSWYLFKTQRLEQDAVSARESIALL